MRTGRSVEGGGGITRPIGNVDLPGGGGAMLFPSDEGAGGADMRRAEGGGGAPMDIPRGGGADGPFGGGVLFSIAARADGAGGGPLRFAGAEASAASGGASGRRCGNGEKKSSKRFEARSGVFIALGIL